MKRRARTAGKRWWAAGALAALAYASTAAASPDYPGNIQAALDLACPPRCTLCHRDRQGGIGTIQSASFGETVMNVSELGADDPASLRCALQLLAPECEAAPPACAAPEQHCFPADTDGDGMSDIEELRSGRDPNHDGAGFLCGASYGCGAEVRAPSDRSGWLLPSCCALAAAAIACSRRRRA